MANSSLITYLMAVLVIMASVMALAAADTYTQIDISALPVLRSGSSSSGSGQGVAVDGEEMGSEAEESSKEQVLSSQKKLPERYVDYPVASVKRQDLSLFAPGARRAY